MFTLRSFCAALLLVSITQVASADTGVARARLDAFLADLESFTATFEQDLFDEYGELLESASGHAAIAKPGRFRWAYALPYEQLIVSDGQLLWVYDIDLEQVSINPLDSNTLDSPAALLSGDVDIENHYDISPSSAAATDETWLTLTPRTSTSQAQYRAIEIGFDGQGLRGMKLRDNLGQLTAITFSNVNRNVDIPVSEFTFSPPPGVDVMSNATIGAGQP